MAMLTITNQTDLGRLRRVALNAQGLTQTNPFGRGPSGVLSAIQHLGYVQIDTISVVERAHHHVLATRVLDYRPSHLHQLLNDRTIFEYWSHAAAFLPMQDYRFSLPYKLAIRSGKRHWSRTRDTKLMNELKRRIAKEGPLRSRDLEAPASRKGTGWWDWKPAKRALEQLYMQGELMIKARDGFQKAYDLTERVVPSEIDTRVPSFAEYAEHLLDQQLRCHGFVTLKGATYCRRDAELRHAMKALSQARLADGALIQCRLGSGEIFFAPPDILDRRLRKSSHRLRILSPFDNSVIQRDRLKALFGFEYQIECYLPESKRKFGYFSLPLLYRDRFIGRMDCKAHRKTSTLQIKQLQCEQHPFPVDEVGRALADALTQFLTLQQCTSITFDSAVPSDSKLILVECLNSLTG